MHGVSLLGNKLSILREMGYYKEDWEEGRLPTRFVHTTNTIDELKQKIAMFDHVSKHIDIDKENTTRSPRVKLGDVMIERGQELIGIQDTNCEILWDYPTGWQIDGKEYFDIGVHVKTELISYISVLFESLACRGAHGPVKLVMDGMRITERDMQAWAFWIGDNAADLRLGQCQLGPHGAKVLSQTVLNDNIVCLDLSRNDLGHAGGMAIANRLTWTGDDIKRHGISDVFDGDPRCTNIRKLNIRDNNVGDDVFERLYKAYGLQSLCQAKMTGKFPGKILSIASGNLLNLDNFKIYIVALIKGALPPHRRDIPDDVQTLFVLSTYAAAQSLVEFGSRSYHGVPGLYGAWGKIALMLAKSGFCQIDVLYEITDCELNDSDAACYSESFHQRLSPNVIIINMRNNHFTDDAAHVFASKLHTMKTQTLLLEGNQITQQGGAALHRAWASAAKPVADGASLRGLCV